MVDKAPIRAVGERYLTSQAAGLRKSGFPTTGLHSIRVRPGAFVESWSSEAFGAGRDFDREIQSWHQPYDVAKLVSIEIFGRLFGAKEPLEQVDEWVSASVKVTH